MLCQPVKRIHIKLEGIFSSEVVRFFLSLSRSPWFKYARAERACLSLLTCQRRVSLFSCSPNVENAHFSAWWLETPICHVFCIRFRLVFNDVSKFQGLLSLFYCNQEFLRRSVCPVIQASATTPGRAGSLTPIFGLTFLGEFDFTDPFVNFFSIS